MSMKEQDLANEIMTAIGGMVTPDRMRVFLALATAIVKHIQTNAVVTGTCPNGAVTGRVS